MRSLGTLLAAALFLLLGCADTGKPSKLAQDRDPPNSPCETSQQCRRYGWCAEKNGECVAGSDGHCENSELCRRSGLCSLEANRCVAKPGDCEDSDWCNRFDLCKASEGVCK